MWTVENYSNVANDVLEKFVDKYYTYDDGDRADDYWWIAEGSKAFVPSVASINDEFWNIEEMVLALKLSIPKHVVMGWKTYADNINREDRNKKNKREVVNLYNYFICCPTNLDETQPNEK